MHSAYEGMILKGRTLANNFVLEFTDGDLPSEFTEDDPALKFSWLACEAGTSPGEDNFCWIDHRDEDLMIDLCDESISTDEGVAKSMSLKGSIKSISFEEDESIPFISEEDESISHVLSFIYWECIVCRNRYILIHVESTPQSHISESGESVSVCQVVPYV